MVNVEPAMPHPPRQGYPYVGPAFGRTAPVGKHRCLTW
jgi:hypothetical protein